METENEPYSAFHSPEQVARKLDLHVRTVRNYVRQGKLKAVRIGKQYRIADADLKEFVRPDGSDGPAARAGREVAARPRLVEGSSIVQIDAIDREQASRVTNTVMASLKGRDAGGPAMRVDTIYDPAHSRLKVILTGDLQSSASLLNLIAVLAEGES